MKPGSNENYDNKTEGLSSGRDYDNSSGYDNSSSGLTGSTGAGYGSTGTGYDSTSGGTTGSGYDGTSTGTGSGITGGHHHHGQTEDIVHGGDHFTSTANRLDPNIADDSAVPFEGSTTGTSGLGSSDNYGSSNTGTGLTGTSDRDNYDSSNTGTGLTGSSGRDNYDSSNTSTGLGRDKYDSSNTGTGYGSTTGDNFDSSNTGTGSGRRYVLVSSCSIQYTDMSPEVKTLITMGTTCRCFLATQWFRGI